MLWDPRRGARRGGVGGFWGGGNVGEAAGAPKAPEQGLMQMHKIPQLAKIPKSVPVCGSGPLVTPWGLCHGAGAALAPGVAFPPGGLRGAAPCSPRSCGAEISLWGGGGGGHCLPPPSVGRGGAFGAGGSLGRCWELGQGAGRDQTPTPGQRGSGGRGAAWSSIDPPRPHPREMALGVQGPLPPRGARDCPCGGRSRGGGG